MKKTLTLLLALLLFSSCTEIIKNYPQKSKFMKVSGGGYNHRMGKYSDEETYGMIIDFKNLPENAHYLIVDFELPNNKGIYERKTYPLRKNQGMISVKSDPIYGVEYGFYYIKAYLAEEESGSHIIDSLEQTIKIIAGSSKGRDYATQYTSYKDDKEVKKTVVITPNKRSKQFITFDISNKFKIGHMVIMSNESMVEYIPTAEDIHDWSKIITIKENPPSGRSKDRLDIFANIVGNLLYKKFSQNDKNIEISYTAENDKKIIDKDDKNFLSLLESSNKANLYIDYANFVRTKKYPNEREFLAITFIKSDKSIWELQCTIRYDKRLSKEKIASLKKEASDLIAGVTYTNNNPVEELKKENVIKAQRLDDREFGFKNYNE